MKVLNYGSLNYDYVYEVEHFVQPGETLTSKSLQKYFGGKGLNQSIALKRAGAEVYHAGMVGVDGTPFTRLCKENGIHSEFIRTVEGVSGHAIIQVNSQGENSIILFEGANAKNTLEQIEEIVSCFDEHDILLVQNEINCLEELVTAAHEKKMTVILNPSPYNGRLTKRIFECVSLFLMNEIEGAQITGKTDPEEMLYAMRTEYPEANVLLTLGSKGSIYDDGEQRIYCPSHKVDVVDTTAAGDTYTGYFIASIQKGLAVKEAMEMATSAAALAVMRKGASTSIPTVEEVKHAKTTLG